MDAFSRNKRIPKIGTVILDESLGSAGLPFSLARRFKHSGCLFGRFGFRKYKNAKKHYKTYEKHASGKADFHQTLRSLWFLIMRFRMGRGPNLILGRVSVQI